MTKRLREYSPADLSEMASKLRLWAASNESAAATAKRLGSVGEGLEEVEDVVEGYRADAATMEDIANVLHQISQLKQRIDAAETGEGE
ncbi:MAG: hypothetical protein AAFX90_21545 [Pseudomonadota bacterium]